MYEIPCYDDYDQIITRLTQWDVNQTIKIKNIEINNKKIEIHFYNNYLSEGLSVEPEILNNIISVMIPNILLQMPSPIIIDVYKYFNKESAKTIGTIKIPITPRKKPEDYIDPSGSGSQPIGQAVGILGGTSKTFIGEAVAATSQEEEEE